MQEKVYEILKDLRPEFDFSGSEDYVEDGLLDSFDIVALVSEIEKVFHVNIDGTEILPENFCNVEMMCKLIEKSDRK